MKSSNRCIKCKGKKLCGRPKCPILERFASIESISSKIPKNDSVFGASPPAVFVGRHGYPDVSAGPMIPPQINRNDSAIMDSPDAWLGMDIQDIISMRSQLVRSNTYVNIRDDLSENSLILKSQELALSKNPVDTEAWYSKSIENNLRFDSVLTTTGPSAALKNFEITENPSVPKKVDYLVYDTDALAKDSVSELINKNISTEHITRLLSIGLLGKDRCLVPTRWSITAVDDMAGKDIISSIIDYPQINDIKLFSGEIFGNHFEILFVPRNFSFELVEIWLPKSVWSGDSRWIGVDYEKFSGKTKYSPLSGGYYAARMGALEYLNNIKRQASIFIIREIRPDYWAPLGVWVVREGVRQALQNTPKTFDSIDNAMSNISTRIKTPYPEWKSKMKLLSDVQSQKTFGDFLF
ncbi:MAG: Nre family DNA repair protein [Methanohalobium sp.]|uniref:Nre family DNA repair protein n=1 Tax=Methanohalobium sp. TaxID=2837493 RepID=UPI00397A466C